MLRAIVLQRFIRSLDTCRLPQNEPLQNQTPPAVQAGAPARLAGSSFVRIGYRENVHADQRKNIGNLPRTRRIAPRLCHHKPYAPGCFLETPLTPGKSLSAPHYQTAVQSRKDSWPNYAPKAPHTPASSWVWASLLSPPVIYPYRCSSARLFPCVQVLLLSG